MSEGAVRSAGPSGGTTVAAPGPVATGPAAGGAEARGSATAGGTTATVTATATATVTIPVPPPGFAAARPGDVLAATVLGRAGEPQLVLNTHLGQLTLPASLALPAGATVQVVIVATEPALQVQVQPTVGGDGRPVPAQLPAPGTPAGTAAAPSPEIGLRVGLVLAGRFVPSPPGPPQLPGPAATTVAPGSATPAAATGPTIDRGAGTILRQAAAPGRAAPAQVPATPGGPSGGASAGASNGATPPQPAGPAPAQIAAPATGAATAEAGALSVRVLAIATLGQPPLPTPGQALAGTVVPGAPPGHTAIETATGVLTLTGVRDVPADSQVLLQVLARPGTVVPASPADRQVQLWRAVADGWPALGEAIEAVRAAAPAAAARLVGGALPQTGPQLTTGTVFFLAALLGDRLQDWLGGDVARLVERAGRPGLLARLGDDFTQLSRLASEPVQGEWRVVILPLLHDGMPEQLRLYLRQERPDGGTADDGEEASTRFIIEARLSRLGPLQLDGLVRQRRFDLIVRSHDALSAAVCERILVIFREAGEDTDFGGSVAFQTTAVFPVAPLNHLDGHAIGLFA